MDTIAVNLFWALVALVAIPSVPFNRMAAVVVAARFANQSCWWLWPEHEPALQAIVFAAAGLLALWLCWRRFSTPCMVVTVLFLPEALASALWATDDMVPVHAWWIIVCCGIAQIVTLPFGNDWRLLREGVAAIRDVSWLDRLLRTHA